MDDLADDLATAQVHDYLLRVYIGTLYPANELEGEGGTS